MGGKRNGNNSKPPTPFWESQSFGSPRFGTTILRIARRENRSRYMESRYSINFFRKSTEKNGFRAVLKFTEKAPELLQVIGTSRNRPPQQSNSRWKRTCTRLIVLTDMPGDSLELVSVSGDLGAAV